MKKIELAPEIIEFLRESNHIEREYSEEALEDAIKAWEYLIEAVPPRSRKKVGLSHILEMHRILLERVDPKLAGKLRTYPVRIGWQIKKYHSLDHLESSLDYPIFLLNHRGVGPKEVKEWRAKTAHIEFEDVHPFGDGNGRSGRILYNWQRLRLGLPIHVIHEGDEQYEYYKWFEKPRQDKYPDWPIS